MKLVGPAVRVILRPGDNLMAHQAIVMAQPGDVFVIGTQGNTTNAPWGEIMSLVAQKRGMERRNR